MGRYQYSDAVEAFDEAVALDASNLDFQVNRAIAVLNRQSENDTKLAMGYLDLVTKADAKHVRAQYCSAIVHLYEGHYDLAKPLLDDLAQQSLNDAYIPYLLATIAQSEGQLDEAKSLFLQAIEQDGYFQSAFYGLFQVCNALGAREEARQYVEEFRKLQNCLRVTKFDFVYGRMGPLAAVQSERASKPPKPLQGLLFAEAVTIAGDWTASQGTPVSFTSLDIDGDEDIDVIAWNLATQSSTHTLLINDQGFLVPISDGFGPAAPVYGCLVGDVNDDGQVDRVLLMETGLNIEGVEGDLTSLMALTQGGVWRDGRTIDADHDGDLDLWLIDVQAGPQLLNNNGDGTWQKIALNVPQNSTWKQSFVGDFDGDRDLDLGALTESGVVHIWWNDRLWAYQSESVTDANAKAVVAFDDLGTGKDCLFTSTTQDVYRQEHRADWLAQKLSEEGAAELAMMDLNGNGALEWISHKERQLSLFVDGSVRLIYEDIDSFHLTQNTPANGFSLLTWSQKTGLSILNPGPGRNPFMVIRTLGRTSAGESMRSNTFGVGTTVAARFDRRWGSGNRHSVSSNPGQDSLYVLVGSASNEQLSYVALQWTDGVYQVEWKPENTGIWEIVETQRQLSSCPLLFVRDENGDTFISDVLGVGGMGFWLAPNEYSEPRPWERFLMPESVGQADELTLVIAEPMEEICILDHADLLVFDGPPQWHVTVDERMGTGEPFPTGNVITYKQTKSLVQATANGKDCLDAVTNDDQVCAPTGDLHPRFLGLLAEPQIVEFELADPIEGPDWILQMGGWIEYPYSQTVFGAWQAGLSYQPASLEVQHMDTGEWLMLHEAFGYPAGFDRESTLPLGHLPFPVKRMRLTTNQEIYWDWLQLAKQEMCADCELTTVKLDTAVLSYMGFPRETGGHDIAKLFDGNRVAVEGGVRTQFGWYTQYGEVTDLVSRPDSHAVFMSPGDEVELRYQLPGQVEGKRRRIIGQFAGWCKDMDLYTHDGDVIGLLPDEELAKSQGRNRLAGGL